MDKSNNSNNNRMNQIKISKIIQAQMQVNSFNRIILKNKNKINSNLHVVIDKHPS